METNFLRPSSALFTPLYTLLKITKQLVKIIVAIFACNWGGVVVVVSSQNCNKGRGLCCRKYVDHAFNHSHFCMYSNNLLVKPVLKEGESLDRVVAFFFH